MNPNKAIAEVRGGEFPSYQARTLEPSRLGMGYLCIWGKVNKPFLEQAVRENKTILFSNNPSLFENELSFFGDEIRWLKGEGYGFIFEAQFGAWKAYRF